MVVEVIEAINHYQDDTSLPDITTDVMGNDITNSAGLALDGNRITSYNVCYTKLLRNGLAVDVHARVGSQ